MVWNEVGVVTVMVTVIVEQGASESRIGAHVYHWLKWATAGLTECPIGYEGGDLSSFSSSQRGRAIVGPRQEKPGSG